MPARGYRLAIDGGRHHRIGSVCAGEHGSQLPGHAVREPDRIGLHVGPPESDPRRHPQERLPGRRPRPDRPVAAAVTLSDADRLAILDLITRADEAASRRDADGYVALFTEDAVL